MEMGWRRGNNKLYNIYKYLNNLGLFRCIRGSLVMMVPVLLIGTFALAFSSLPIDAYQNFIDNTAGGVIRIFFEGLYQVTFGILSVYMTICLSLCYIKQNMSMRNHNYGALFTSLICFFIFSGAFSGENFDISVLGPQGIFTSLVCAILASYLYDKINQKMGQPLHIYVVGIDESFISMLFSIFPMVIVCALFMLANTILKCIFEVTGIQMLFVNLMNGLFDNRERSLGTALLFELFIHLFWFFGIHGDDVLYSAKQDIFAPAIDINKELVAQGPEATEVYSKTFFDVFVTMGGCGTAICLLAAVLIFSKRRSDRNLAKFASVPLLFNINEIMVFGLPIVFNPVLFIPFITTPVVLTLVSTFAVSVGLVPIPVNSVEWTTPVILGGYLATDSMAGAVLQIVNIIIGVCIYSPFIRVFEKETFKNAESRMQKLVETVKENEVARNPITLLSLQDDSGVVARSLAEELVLTMRTGKLDMFYQPQFNDKGECIGAEALLRWKHSLYGTVYPPLVVKLAEEADVLLKMEECVFETVCSEMDRLCKIFGDKAKISVNVTGKIIQSGDFEKFLAEVSQRYSRWCKNITIEITEQDTLAINETLIERLTRIRDMGFGLAIDDFSMGSTSIKYLQTNLFTLIKLDGQLTRDIVDNERSRDIVASITKLSHDFNIKVLAEYVETEEQRQMLEDIDCHWYQGYLYSPAVKIDELEESVKMLNKR